MGKIVKYCNDCEEGFAEKFVFCPNCGSGLTAFELNPVQPAVSENIEQISKQEVANIVETTENIPVPNEVTTTFTNPIHIIDEPIIQTEPEVFVAPVIAETIEPTVELTKKVEDVILPIVPEKTVTISNFTSVFSQSETKQFDSTTTKDPNAVWPLKKTLG